MSHLWCSGCVCVRECECAFVTFALQKRHTQPQKKLFTPSDLCIKHGKMIRFACQHARNEIDWIDYSSLPMIFYCGAKFLAYFSSFEHEFLVSELFFFVFVRYFHLNFIFNINFANVPLEFAKKSQQRQTNLREWKMKKKDWKDFFFYLEWIKWRFIYENQHPEIGR